MSLHTMTNSVVQLLLKNERESGDRVYLRQPRDGVWYEYTWSEVMQKARAVAGFLYAQGLKKGDHVSIVSKNCAEWFITDFGITIAGMVNVPLFPNQHEDSVHYILKHAEIKLVFIGKLDDPELMRKQIPKKYKTVGFDYHDSMQVDHTWSDVMASESLVDLVEPMPEDLYTIIFSSGTSGLPKGAMFTHQTIANYLTVFPASLFLITNRSDHKMVSYLPLAHVMERVAVELSSLVTQSQVSFIESLDKFAQNLQEIKPTLFIAVPRIWGVFQQKIEQKLPPAKLNFLLKIPLISSLIKKKIRHGLGFENDVTFLSGASYLPQSIFDFFNKIGIPIQEGYGQTENLAYVSISRKNEIKAGYVGTPLIGVELKTLENRELVMRSDFLMSGYYKDPDASAKAFTEDGWLRTGDEAEIDAKGRLKIYGRMSEHFKNQSGEFVTPGPIEKKFAACGLAEHLCLVGRGLPGNMLLMTLNESVRSKSKDDIKKNIEEVLEKINAHLARYEKITRVIIVKGSWTTENAFLTPTLKIKRKEVEARYEALIQNVLTQNEVVVWE